MKPIDLLGGPTRKIIPLLDGRVKVVVTPPAWSGFNKSRSVTLTPDQYEGYQHWLSGELIQNALPSLSASDREILISGIGPGDL